MNKFIFWTLGLYLNSVDTTSEVHIMCETNIRSNATVVASMQSKFNAEMCVFLTGCGLAEGKIYFDKFSDTGVYISQSKTLCR